MVPSAIIASISQSLTLPFATAMPVIAIRAFTFVIPVARSTIVAEPLVTSNRRSWAIGILVAVMNGRSNLTIVERRVTQGVKKAETIKMLDTRTFLAVEAALKLQVLCSRSRRRRRSRARDLARVAPRDRSRHGIVLLERVRCHCAHSVVVGIHEDVRCDVRSCECVRSHSGLTRARTHPSIPHRTYVEQITVSHTPHTEQHP